MNKVIQEFKTFILRGNVVDLAVGIIIGGAFGKIVTSMINDILMPPLGLLINNMDFRDLKITIGGDKESLVSINYGNFIQTAFEFLLIALAVFILVRFMNALHRKEETPVVATTPREEELLTEIRDILKNNNA
ncbi:MAG: large-conductance mechanosensitive channel protein MscL [Sphingobacteriia bacterium]|nr:large-conductance mechanosensitive channel protein MscL [Sphingobacteriia bacterium]